jgi:hypothetical protein
VTGAAICVVAHALSTGAHHGCWLSIGCLLAVARVASRSKIAEKMQTNVDADADNLHNADKCRHIQTDCG